jgi:HD-GYP domain-containing protein (c-di-GMP phosphodiesterase class II)
MIVKIGISRLEPGMHITNPGLSQENNPNIFLAETTVDDPVQVEAIRSQHFSDVFVDTEKGTYFLTRPEEKAELENPFAVVSSGRPQDVNRGARFDSIAANIEKTDAYYKEFIDYARGFIDSLKLTRNIDVKASEDFVDSIITRADESGDALMFLAKLKCYDAYAYTHCLNVSMLSVLFGRHIGLGYDNIMSLGLSGLFHDVGKIRIPAKILKKPGKLVPAELREAKRHPLYGKEILEGQPDMPSEPVRVALEHHEFFDGGGYPNGLQGSQISPASALVGVMDTFDAMTTDRCYKPAVSPHKAISVIFNLRGKVFSPSLVDRFIRFAGIYPVGAIVVLDDGRKAIVMEQNQESLLQPIIRVILDENNRYCKSQDINLMEAAGEGGALRIVDCLSTRECRVHIASFLPGVKL